MSVRQLSVFAENKKGTLHEITDILANAGVDMRTMCVADTSDFGIVRIIADNPDAAEAALRAAGHAANVREVNAFAVSDCPGGLSKALSVIETNGVNIEYVYALVTSNPGKAYTVMRTDDTERADAILAENKIELLDEKDI